MTITILHSYGNSTYKNQCYCADHMIMLVNARETNIIFNNHPTNNNSLGTGHTVVFQIYY
jgi:hypothetical protein